MAIMTKLAFSFNVGWLPKNEMTSEEVMCFTVLSFACAAAFAAKNYTGLCREHVLNLPFQVTLAGYPKIKIHLEIS